MKVSILSPVFNESLYIDEMIRTVVAQSHSDWELLFVDDGSTDETADLIHTWTLTDPRIKLVSRDQKLGKVAAFNRAFDESSGSLLVLLAGDDRLPPDSLAIRHDSLFGSLGEVPETVGFFKIRTFSDQRRFDGMVLPKGGRSSRSGGSITLSRPLAQQLFPIDESLVSEDIWLASGATGLANKIVLGQEIVLDYRIHAGNSNPRMKPFQEMSDSIHSRHRAFKALLECQRFKLDEKSVCQLSTMWNAEQLRRNQRTLRLLITDLPILDRAAFASMSNPALYRLRSYFYGFFSGLRER